MEQLVIAAPTVGLCQIVRAYYFDKLQKPPEARGVFISNSRDVEKHVRELVVGNDSVRFVLFRSKRPLADRHYSRQWEKIESHIQTVVHTFPEYNVKLEYVDLP